MLSHRVTTYFIVKIIHNTSDFYIFICIHVFTTQRPLVIGREMQMFIKSVQLKRFIQHNKVITKL